MSTLRVLVVIKNLQQGGTERQVTQLVRSMGRGDVDVALCTLAPEMHFDDLPAGEPRFPFDVKGSAAVRAIAGAIDQFRPHLVHSFRDAVNRLVHRALAQAEHQPRWIFSVRGRPVLPRDLLAARFMQRRAFRITVNSRGVARTLRRWSGIPRAKIELTPNFLDTSIEPPTTSQWLAARAALGVPLETFLWVLPGRLSWVKNQLGLLAAIAWLKLRGRLPRDVVWLLAGRARDRLAAQLIRLAIRALRLTDIVRVRSAVRDVRQLYAAADALVLPSWAEGMPNVVLESQLSGLPVVVTKGANADDLVTSGRTGFVVKTGSPRALATAMAGLMSMSETERERMGMKGRHELLAWHERQGVVSQLRTLYEVAAADGSPAHPLSDVIAADETTHRQSAATPDIYEPASELGDSSTIVSTTPP